MKAFVALMLVLGSTSAFAAAGKCEKKAQKVAVAIERSANEQVGASDRISVRSTGSGLNYEVELTLDDGSKSYYRVALSGHSTLCWGVRQVTKLQD